MLAISIALILAYELKLKWQGTVEAYFTMKYCFVYKGLQGKKKIQWDHMCQSVSENNLTVLLNYTIFNIRVQNKLSL